MLNADYMILKTLIHETFGEFDMLLNAEMLYSGRE